MRQKTPTYGSKATLLSKIAIGILVAGMVIMAIFVAWQFYNMPEYATEREFNYLAKDYYENYLYDKTLSSLNQKSITEAFSIYDEKGMEPIKLRQLLLYDEEKHPGSAAIFDTPHYKCDTNLSEVKYHPSAPYGRTDYTYELKLTCNKR